jgi:tripartite-type tricarboxylate transporter receptor subunit TctC
MFSRFIVLLAVWPLPGMVSAQPAWPSKPIRFIVGPGPDALARVFGQKMTEDWGQPVLVDQRGGGGGTISSEVVARAAPDGYTILLATGTHTINPSLYKLPYDMVKDFAPVTLIASTPFILGVHPSVPVKSVAELIQYAKARPGALNYGSGGQGTPPHLSMELLKSMAGVSLVHIPYKTVPEAVTDLVAGRVQVMFMVGPVGLPQIQAGKVRGLAVSNAKRSAFVPDLPTVAESGLPGYGIFGWNGVLAPAGTPREIITRLRDEIANALKLPAIRESIAKFGFEAVGSTPEEFAEFVRADIAQWAKVARDSGAKVE